MQFSPLMNSDARIIDLVLHADNRGGFSRVWCRSIFGQAGLEFEPVQGNTSFTQKRGTVRGMHFQRHPRADAKIVRCTRGRIHDVIVDLREGSPLAGQCFSCELAEDEARMLYIPPGFAHGFQTLTDDVVVEYLMGVEYVPALYDGARHDDPILSIEWPDPVIDISEKDLSWPDLTARMPWLQKEAVDAVETA